MPDPVTALVGAGTFGVLAKQAQDFISAACGYPGETIGTMLGHFANRRMRNAENVAANSHLILLNIGLRAGEVPLNVLQPVLEAASLQEEPYLQDIWANLLANAADPRQKNPVEPSFAATLKELSHREVRFLQELFQEMKDINLQLPLRGLQMTYVNAGLRRGPQPENAPHIKFPELMDFKDQKQFSIMMDILTRARIIAPITNKSEAAYQFTEWGLAFIRACQKPTGSELLNA